MWLRPVALRERADRGKIGAAGSMALLQAGMA
jgi:hypothetical protein